MGARASRGRAVGLILALAGCNDDVVEAESVGDEIGTSTISDSGSDSTGSIDSESGDSESGDSSDSESSDSSDSESSDSESSDSESSDSESSDSESSDSTETEGCPAGSEACPCDAGTCAGGLICADDLCILGPVCGDAIVEFGEACDDGNAIDLDGCNVDCKLTGALVWEQRIGEPGSCDYFHGVDVGTSGLIVAVGSRDKLADPTHDCQAIVHAFDTDGTPLWAFELGSPVGDCDQAWGVDIDEESRVYVTGHFADPITKSDQFMIALSPLGELIWQKVLTRDLDEFGYGLAVDALGHIAVAGAVQQPGLDYDLSLRVYDNQGAELWSDVFASDGSAFALDVAAKDAIVVTGFGTTQGQAQDVWVRKYALDGTPSWTQTHDAAQHGNDRGGGVAIDDAGRIAVAGFVTGPSNHDIWIRKWDEAGVELWSQGWDDPQLAWADRGQDVALDGEGHVIVAGQSWSVGANQNSFDGWLAKYDAEGQLIWLEQTSFPVDGEDVWFAVDTDTSDGSIVVAGATTTEAGACTDAVVRCYNP